MKKTVLERLKEQIEKWNAEVAKKEKQMQIDAKSGNYSRAAYLQTQTEIMRELITDAEVIASEIHNYLNL